MSAQSTLNSLMSDESCHPISSHHLQALKAIKHPVSATMAEFNLKITIIYVKASLGKAINNNFQNALSK
jgi:hypothetical protein